jgi:hypothetical protein
MMARIAINRAFDVGCNKTSAFRSLRDAESEPQGRSDNSLVEHEKHRREEHFS